MTSRVDLGQRLADGNRLVMVNPGTASLPPRLDGADALFIDREGTGLSIEDAGHLVEKAATLQIASVVRTDGLAQAELIKCAALTPDAVVLPQLRTSDELRSTLAVFSLSSTDVIAQIETVEAIETLTEFMAVDGVTAFLIGPNDLAAAMGHAGQPDHRNVVATVEDVATQLVGAGLRYGLPTPTRDACERWRSKGAQLHYLPLQAFLEMDMTS